MRSFIAGMGLGVPMFIAIYILIHTCVYIDVLLRAGG